MTCIVKKMIKNPITGKRVGNVSVMVNGQVEIFRWNTAFHLYNSTKNYRQLGKEQIKDIIWL